MRASMGVIGYVFFLFLGSQNFDRTWHVLTLLSDLAEAYPNGELVDAFRQDWLAAMIKETKTNRDFQPRTIETARWAREQVKRQLGGAQNVMSQA